MTRAGRNRFVISPKGFDPDCLKLEGTCGRPGDLPVRLRLLIGRPGPLGDLVFSRGPTDRDDRFVHRLSLERSPAHGSHPEMGVAYPEDESLSSSSERSWSGGRPSSLSGSSGPAPGMTPAGSLLFSSSVM